MKQKMIFNHIQVIYLKILIKNKLTFLIKIPKRFFNIFCTTKTISKYSMISLALLII